MIATTFPEANRTFGPPPGYAESQIVPIKAFVGRVGVGSVDGDPLVVTAWQPTAAELEALNAGAPVFCSFIGGLPPHFLTTNFREATNPA